MLKFIDPEQKYTVKKTKEERRAIRQAFVEQLKPETVSSVQLMNGLVSQLIKKGCREKAFRFVREALDIMQDKGVSYPMDALVQALERIKPVVGFRVFKKKNKILRIPHVLNFEAEWRKACHNLAQAAAKRRENTVPQRLAGMIMELLDKNSQTDLLKRKEEDEKMAVQNLMYFRYIRKWKFTKRRVT